MPRDARAYLNDILESCDVIAAAVQTLDLAAYQESRLVRSSVEREFIIIGEAMAALARVNQIPGNVRLRLPSRHNRGNSNLV
jgi:uncharacterized protein with HEPN domain